MGFCGLGAFVDHVTGLATKKEEAFVHAMLTFLQRQFAITTELVGQVVLLWHRRIGCLARVLLRCRRRVQGAAGCQTGGRRLSTPVVVRGVAEDFGLSGLFLDLAGVPGSHAISPRRSQYHWLRQRMSSQNDSNKGGFRWWIILSLSRFGSAK